MIKSIEGGIEIAVKVVPGASRDRIVGALGDALKVSVAAPAEGGKANAAVCELIAAALGAAKRDVSVTQGPTQPRKRLTVRGVSEAEARSRLGRFCG